MPVQSFTICLQTLMGHLAFSFPNEIILFPTTVCFLTAYALCNAPLILSSSAAFPWCGS